MFPLHRIFRCVGGLTSLLKGEERPCPKGSGSCATTTIRYRDNRFYKLGEQKSRHSKGSFSTPETHPDPRTYPRDHGLLPRFFSVSSPFRTENVLLLCRSGHRRSTVRTTRHHRNPSLIPVSTRLPSFRSCSVHSSRFRGHWTTLLHPIR